MASDRINHFQEKGTSQHIPTANTQRILQTSLFRVFTVPVGGGRDIAYSASKTDYSDHSPQRDTFFFFQSNIIDIFAISSQKHMCVLIRSEALLMNITT